MPVFLALDCYDFICSYYLWDDYKDRMSDLSYYLFERSGHWPMFEEQTLFDEKLITWLESQCICMVEIEIS